MRALRSSSSASSVSASSRASRSRGVVVARRRLGERDALLRRVLALFRAALAGVLDQDLAHRARRDGEEVRAVLKPGVGAVEQLDVGGVDEVRRLHAVRCPLLAHVRRGQLPELPVDDGQQLLFEKARFCRAFRSGVRRKKGRPVG